MNSEELRREVLQVIGGGRGKPMNKSELIRTLNLPSHLRSELRQTLATLVAEGHLVEGRKGRFEAPGRSNDELRGTLKFLPRGHAWFYPDLTLPDNLATGIDLKQHSRLHVPRRDTGTALDGDQVVVRFVPPPSSPRRNPRGHRQGENHEPPDARGKVLRVLSRRSGRMVGTFRRKGKFSWVECDDPAVQGNIHLNGDTTASPGQLVVVDLEQWQSSNQDPRGRIIEVLGWPGDAGVDILSIIHRQGLRTTFPDAVLQAARSTEETPSPAEISRREDWRDRLVITIDPADAKDHDDAIWVSATPKGWQVAVHIADVSHYVKPGTPIDVEAIERGNSTYLVDRVLPMLPTELSNGICSLKPHVDRLTKCAVIDVAKDGRILRSRFCDAVIHSQAKLSYEQAQTILDGGNAPDHSDSRLVPMVREAWNMAATLRQRRFAEGALDLEMPEIRVTLDDKGRATGVRQVEHTSSHQLIEECMLAANEAVAKLLRSRTKPAIYRIHEDPDAGKLLEYSEAARAHGYQPGDLSQRAHIQKLLNAAKGRPDEHLIKLGLLKSLKRAAYAADPLGHYGLAKADYCHFTSPIRRYADLVVHRALQPFLDNPPRQPDSTPGHAKLEELSRHLSDTERTSSDSESESRQIKMLEYLETCAANPSPPTFSGVITDVRPVGLLVEATDLGARGMVKREDLPGGPWLFEASALRFSQPSGRRFQLGDRVELQVHRIDREKKFVDFRITSAPTQGGFQAWPARETQPKPRKSAKTSAPFSDAPRGDRKRGGKKSKTSAPANNNPKGKSPASSSEETRKQPDNGPFRRFAKPHKNSSPTRDSSAENAKPAKKKPFTPKSSGPPAKKWGSSKKSAHPSSPSSNQQKKRRKSHPPDRR